MNLDEGNHNANSLLCKVESLYSWSTGLESSHGGFVRFGALTVVGDRIKLREFFLESNSLSIA